MEGKHCVYLLFSKKTNKYYIGKTIDIARRFKEHNNGEEIYTRTGSPWELVGTIECENGSESAKLENKLKKSKNRKYIVWYFKNYNKI